MILKQLYAESLSQASYLIGDEISAQAVIVDPLRDIDQYLDEADRYGLHIVGVILTHFHADFLAGHLELAARTGAWVGLGDRARPEFDARLLFDGERIALGDVELEIMATPGHTPESISVLVFDGADELVAEAVLTGDSLFVGDIGRVDLQAIFGADPVALAHEQYETIQHRFMSLADSVRVLPAHGAGSACGKNLSPDRESTIGRERLTNECCRPMTREAFVALITTGQPPAPAYFAEDARLNREHHELFDATAPMRRIDRFADIRRGNHTDDAVANQWLDDAQVLDTRDVEDFVAGHLPRALNVPLNGRFAETAGMFLDFGRAVVLVAEPGLEAEARRQLARIGFDKVAGYVPAYSSAMSSANSEPHVTEQLIPGYRIEAADLDELRNDPSVVLIDVRGPDEFESVSVPGAVNIPLPQLLRRKDSIRTDSTVIVNCASGWRSGVASSFLQAEGFAVADVRGGIQAWTRIQTEPLLEVVGDDLQAPLLSGETTRYVNLDYAASAPALKTVAERVSEVLPFYASVHRGTGYASQVSTAAYEGARTTVAELLGARPADTVIFTRNSTDSLNLIASVVPGDTVFLDIEHHANLLPWQAAGGRVVVAAPTIAETLARIEFELNARPAAALAITAASNVTGEILPIRALADLAHRHGARIIVDGAQFVPHRRVNMTELDIDYIAFSAHKIYAPFGSGALIGRSDWLDAGDPYLRGGGAVENVTLQETTWLTGPDRHEGGSPNVIGAVALAHALQTLASLDEAAWLEHEKTLRARLVAGLTRVPGVELLRIFGDSTDQVGVVSFSVAGMDSALVAAVLSSEYGIGVRDGRFCAHPLVERLGVSDGAIRASFGVGSRMNDADSLVEALEHIIADGPAWSYEYEGGGWTAVGDARVRPEWAPALEPALVRAGCAT